MITRVVHYTIDPARIEAFERFAREWMRLVTKRGGSIMAISCVPTGRAIEPIRFQLLEPGCVRTLSFPVR